MDSRARLNYSTLESGVVKYEERRGETAGGLGDFFFSFFFFGVSVLEERGGRIDGGGVLKKGSEGVDKR